MRLFTVAVFLCSLSVSLLAQTGTLHFEKIEGLSQSTGYAIMKDRQGFLWIATANGLNRFDGVEMKVYKPELDQKHGSMVGRVIRSELLEDDQQRIWFSTDVSVHHFDKKTERFVSYPLSVAGKKPTNLFANPLLLDGKYLWLASADAGLFYLNLETKESINFPVTVNDEARNPIRLMYNGVFDKKANFWFATNKGLLVFNLATRQWQRHLGGKSLYSIAYCHDTLYITEGKDVIRVAISDPASVRGHYSQFSPTGRPDQRGHIHRVYADTRSNVWTGDENGNVFCKPSRSDNFRWMGNINLESTIRTNYPVYCLYADSAGILWTGSYMLGLMKAAVTNSSFTTFPKLKINAVSENLFVNAFYENGADEVWLGTFQKGITILNRKTGTTEELRLRGTGKRLIYGNSVHLIQRDAYGNLWTGMSGFLFVKEYGQTQFTRIGIPAPSNALLTPQVWSLIEYKNGWLVGTNIGLYVLSKADGAYNMVHISWLGQKRITALLKQDNDNVWIGFESGGVAIVADPRVSREARQLFQETNVTSLQYDPQRKLLWIGTSNGLIAYNVGDGKYKIFSETNGLSNSYVYSVLQDSAKLWIGTQHGLFRADVQFSNNSLLPQVTFTRFTHKDGLPDNQFIRGAASKGAFSNDLYFGTIKGIVWFNPARIKPNHVPPAMVLTAISANDQVIDSTLAAGFTKKISLPYFKNNLLFRFRGIEYINPTQVQYAYQLHGWDKDWVYNGTLNEVRYNNLSPGKYLFKVKAANESGIWNEKSCQVEVTIIPPFWKTGWFYATLSLVTLTTVVAATRRIALRRMQKKLAELEMQRKLDAERQRISKEMHDDIGAGLTQIALLSESAKRKSGYSPNKELTDISDTSRQLVTSMSEIVWSLNPENSTLDHLLTYLREQLSRQLEYSGIQYQINFPAGADITISNEFRRNILLVTKEVVNNAIKHSKATHIRVNAEINNGLLSFRVRDDGVGFDAQKRYSGNGLRNLRDRIAALDGALEISSHPGNGAEFFYVVGLRSTQLR